MQQLGLQIPVRIIHHCPYTSDDLNKKAIQSDTVQEYVLTATTPTWTPQSPTFHASTHLSTGSDSIAEFTGATGVADGLDGLVKKPVAGDNVNFLRGDGTWAAASGSGENNTASNVGIAGVGVFKQKVGVDLEFKKINAGSNK